MEAQTGTKKILVAYFSQSGNTRSIARQIHQKTGGDLFEIERAIPYSQNYDTFAEEARREQQQQARPALKNHVTNMAQYDVVFLGYPIWWSSIPMPVASFLEEYDFSGKTIIPFCSSGGGGSGRSRSVIAELASRSTVAETFAVRTSGGPSLSNDISAWLRGNNIAEQ
ncbi:MAG: NAD(P)H-dependent oxidoreductase [Treponema sp.]|nr:NAD(P)H-dependent oxidoreductase [Treponema sp.]